MFHTYVILNTSKANSKNQKWISSFHTYVILNTSKASKHRFQWVYLSHLSGVKSPAVNTDYYVISYSSQTPSFLRNKVAVLLICNFVYFLNYIVCFHHKTQVLLICNLTHFSNPKFLTYYLVSTSSHYSA